MSLKQKTLLVFIYVLSFANLCSQEIEGYNYKPNKIQSLKIDSLSFDYFNSDFKLFLMGEKHNYKYSDKIAFDLFKSALTNDVVNSIILEHGISTEIIFNYYDTNIMIEIKHISKDYYEYVNKFHNLHSNNAFNLYGIDIEKNLYESIFALIVLTNNSKVEHISSMNDYLLDITRKITTPKILEKFVNKFLNDFSLNNRIYREDLEEEKYAYLNKLVEEIKTYIKTHENGNYIDNDNNRIIREEHLCNSFMEIILSEKDTNNKYFGSFGNGHVLNNRNSEGVITQWPSFSNMIEEKGINICRVMPLYEYNYRKSNYFYYVIPYEDMYYYRKYATTSLTLFDMKEDKNYMNKYGYEYLLYIKGGNRWNREGNIFKWWFSKK